MAYISFAGSYGTGGIESVKNSPRISHIAADCINFDF